MKPENLDLNEEDKKFLASRQKLSRYWPYIGTLMLILILGLAFYLVFNVPLLANPFEVMDRLSRDAVPKSSLVTMAGILPLVFHGVILLLLSLVIIGFSLFSFERRYQRIISKLASESELVP